jgi:hypothetical protein
LRCANLDLIKIEQSGKIELNSFVARKIPLETCWT